MKAELPQLPSPRRGESAETYFLVVVAFVLTFPGCRGSAPAYNADPAEGISAILMRCQLILPSGEIREGGVDIDLESDSKTYRLSLSPDKTIFYFLRPDAYRLAPARGLLGQSRPNMT